GHLAVLVLQRVRSCQRTGRPRSGPRERIRPRVCHEFRSEDSGAASARGEGWVFCTIVSVRDHDTALRWTTRRQDSIAQRYPLLACLQHPHSHTGGPSPTATPRATRPARIAFACGIAPQSEQGAAIHHETTGTFVTKETKQMLRQYVDLACQDDEPDAGARQLLGGMPRPKPPPRSKTGGGTSPLHLASCRGHVGVVHELLLAGADATRGDQFGFSALHLAARHGFPDVIAELLSFGRMSVDMLDESGETALHTAARYAKTLSVWRLLESGIDWTIVSKSGRRAIDVIGQGQDKHNLQSLPHSATQLCNGRRAVKFSASANMPPAQLPRDKCTEKRVRRLLTGAAARKKQNKDGWSWPVIVGD
ncbi:unnamed protein product, partial [Laminaria digitata]